MHIRLFSVPTRPENSASVQLRNGRLCVDTLGHDQPNMQVGVYGCHSSGGNQLWQYAADSGRLRHFNLCLTVVALGQAPVLGQCQGKVIT